MLIYNRKLAMQEFIAINEQRAEFYWWMSSLFSTELTEQDLVNYQSDDMAQYLALLGMTPELAPAVKKFNQSLEKQSKREDGQLELAADFCGLFLTTPKSGALPYASIYIGESGLLNDKPAQDMAKWMERYQIAQRKEFKEPFDHLAVILDFMGNLVILANKETNEIEQEKMMQEQLLFLTTFLIPWIEPFEQALGKHDIFGFYHSASSLLVQFLLLDLAFLKSE